MHLIYNNVKKIVTFRLKTQNINIAIENCKLNLETYIKQKFIMKFDA
jgi:hypothetical protein